MKEYLLLVSHNTKINTKGDYIEKNAGQSDSKLTVRE
jgi:hypothetical protein